MSSPEEEWWKEIAAEYVLGTLRGADLELFKTILETDEEARQEVIRWERRLAPLNETTAPQKPDAQVWLQIQQRIRASAEQRQSAIDAADAFNADQAHPDDIVDDVVYELSADGDPSLGARAHDTQDAPTGDDLESTQPIDDEPLSDANADRITFDPIALEPPAAKRNYWWPSIAVLATAASVLMGVLLSRQMQLLPATPSFKSDGVSIVFDDQANPLWLVQADFTTDRLQVTALAPPPIDSGKDYELWQVMPDEAGVASVGLLPEGTGLSREISVEKLASVFDAFAVSVEPTGGSPATTPTGPVMYQGTFVHTRGNTDSVN